MVGCSIKMKEYKYKGIINIYTGIIFNIQTKEIFICNDAGRLTRPVLKVKNNKLLLNKKYSEYIFSGECQWEEFFINHNFDAYILNILIIRLEKKRIIIKINREL